VYGDVQSYRRAMAEELDTGVLLDAGMLYADARLSTRFPTVEVRVADVPLTAEATASVAGLVRGLVASAAAASRRGDPLPTCSAATLRLASWQAALDGLRGALVDPRTGHPAPAAEVVAALVDFASPGLDAHGDAHRVREGVDRILTEGNGAAWQRATLLAAGTMSAMVLAAADTAMEEALGGPGLPVAQTA